VYDDAEDATEKKQRNDSGEDVTVTRRDRGR
jgi:hypothetical protein